MLRRTILALLFLLSANLHTGDAPAEWRPAAARAEAAAAAWRLLPTA